MGNARHKSLWPSANMQHLRRVLSSPSITKTSVTASWQPSFCMHAVHPPRRHTQLAQHEPSMTLERAVTSQQASTAARSTGCRAASSPSPIGKFNEMPCAWLMRARRHMYSGSSYVLHACSDFRVQLCSDVYLHADKPSQRVIPSHHGSCVST